MPKKGKGLAAALEGHLTQEHVETKKPKAKAKKGLKKDTHTAKTIYLSAALITKVDKNLLSHREKTGKHKSFSVYLTELIEADLG